MNTKARPAPRTGASRQRGATTLVVVLLVLVVAAMIGLASLRGTVMEENMSAGVRDRGLSFQAAEAALREGEQVAAGRPAMPASGCSKGLCAKPNPAAAPVWEDQAVWNDAPETVVKLGADTARPKYIVELLATNVPPKSSCTTGNVIGEGSCTGTESRYRITALSQADGRAEVMLQSIYAVP